jgi:hypothetical protein
MNVPMCCLCSCSGELMYLRTTLITPSRSCAVKRQPSRGASSKSSPHLDHMTIPICEPSHQNLQWCLKPKVNLSTINLVFPCTKERCGCSVCLKFGTPTTVIHYPIPLSILLNSHPVHFLSGPKTGAAARPLGRGICLATKTATKNDRSHFYHSITCCHLELPIW